MRIPSANLAAFALLLLRTPAPADWLTFGHDPQRSGWASEETDLTPENIAGMGLLWKSKLEVQPYSLFALTTPVVASHVSTRLRDRSVAYVGGITGAVFAIDAETGETLWTHTFKNLVESNKKAYMFQGGFLCPNGITATPVIDQSTGTLYFVGPDGMLHGVDFDEQTWLFVPMAGPPAALSGGRIFTTDHDGNVYCFGLLPKIA